MRRTQRSRVSMETDTGATRHTQGSPAAGGGREDPPGRRGGVWTTDPSMAAQVLNPCLRSCGEDPPAAQSTQQRQTPGGAAGRQAQGCGRRRGVVRAGSTRHRCLRRDLGRAWGLTTLWTHCTIESPAGRTPGRRPAGEAVGPPTGFWIVDGLMVKSL